MVSPDRSEKTSCLHSVPATAQRRPSSLLLIVPSPLGVARGRRTFLVASRLLGGRGFPYGGWVRESEYMSAGRSREV
jgi:hypothetical protein